jgi:N utilization substance protein B
MNSRHRAREVALQILYQYDLTSLASGRTPPTDLALIADLRHHFDHFNVPESLREFVGELVAGTLAHLVVLDAELEKHASNWKVTRMSSVDRSLLRMATFEMTRLRKVPETIVIDEAIELAKQFGTEDTPGFVNGVLDSIKTSQVKIEA